MDDEPQIEIEIEDADERYPLWEHTEWTRDQRAVAIVGLLSLALASVLFVSALAAWGMTPLALNTLIPLGVILFCLGTTLITAAFCYVYIHSHNNIGYSFLRDGRGYGSRAGFAWVMSALLMLELACELLSLVMQIVVNIQILLMGWSGWQATTLAMFGAPTFIADALLSLCIAFNLVLPPGFLTASFTWRPTRDPTAPDSVLSAPVAGVRFELRWLIMCLPWGNILLLGGLLYVLLVVGASLPILPAVCALGVLGAFFLVAALAELTHRP